MLHFLDVLESMFSLSHNLNLGISVYTAGFPTNYFNFVGWIKEIDL